MAVRVTVYVDDRDFTLYVGDVRQVLAELPAESVDCVVTSPPYWGLRDYGTGQWAGGNPDCDHVQRVGGKQAPAGSNTLGRDASHPNRETLPSTGHALIETRYRDVCGKCGASRVDRQIGLEATPELFVQAMVEVFREVRRVLAPHGTCWVNLGDSYAASSGNASDKRSPGMATSVDTRTVPGLKPKDLVGVPWRVAFALQADGWWLRSEIIWAKKNCMPESVTDRPTKSHEQIFLLTKQPRYWFDAEAVREPSTGHGQGTKGVGEWNKLPAETKNGRGASTLHSLPEAGRNVRSVWEIATQPYPEAHFATFPEALPDRCIRAGCPERVCRTCGKPSERIVEAERRATRPGYVQKGAPDRKDGGIPFRPETTFTTVGWSDCGHNTWRTGVVLDPFMGSGTTALVARRLGRRSIGVELNESCAELCARRLSQLSLFAEEMA